MKTIFSVKRFFVAAALFGVSSLSFADSFNNVWVKADVTPANSGKVFIDWNIDEVSFAATSEFKRSINMGASNAFILAQPAEGWLFAGVARDMDRDNQFDATIDRQIHVFHNFFFTAFYDHTDYTDPSSSTNAQRLAEQALAQMEYPTDQVFAVFTQGVAAYRAEGQEAAGYVYCSKLNNEPGDQVTFYAYGDCDSRNSPNVYYKFDYWSDANGNEVSRSREYEVTAGSMQVLYAHFAVTTKADYQENEKVPEKFKFDYNNPPFNPLGIEEVNVGNRADKAVYNLQGRRVVNLQKGMFIQNGKKFVVR